jgi:hypothetical protein
MDIEIPSEHSKKNKKNKKGIMENNSKKHKKGFKLSDLRGPPAYENNKCLSCMNCMGIVISILEIASGNGKYYK